MVLEVDYHSIDFFFSVVLWISVIHSFFIGVRFFICILNDILRWKHAIVKNRISQKVMLIPLNNSDKKSARIPKSLTIIDNLK